MLTQMQTISEQLQQVQSQQQLIQLLQQTQAQPQQPSTSPAVINMSAVPDSAALDLAVSSTTPSASAALQQMQQQFQQLQQTQLQQQQLTIEQLQQAQRQQQQQNEELKQQQELRFQQLTNYTRDWGKFSQQEQKKQVGRCKTSDLHCLGCECLAAMKPQGKKHNRKGNCKKAP